MPINQLGWLTIVNNFLNLKFSKEKELQKTINLTAKVSQTTIAFMALLDISCLKEFTEDWRKALFVTSICKARFIQIANESMY